MSHLVQCRLVEGQLQSNPLYSSRSSSGCSPQTHNHVVAASSTSSDSSSSPYQVTNLDKHFTYDNIGPDNSSTPMKVPTTTAKYLNGNQAKHSSMKTNAHGDMNDRDPKSRQMPLSNGQTNQYYNTGKNPGSDEQPHSYYNVSPIDITPDSQPEMTRDSERKSGGLKKPTVRAGDNLHVYEEIPNSDGDSSSHENVALMPDRSMEIQCD